MSPQLKNAMIFAAGLGTRLMPLTQNLPKALAPINGQTLLFYALKKMEAYGVKNVVVNTHHFSERIEEWLDCQSFNFDISISKEEVLLDTAGGLAFAAPSFPSGDILLYNVDVISSIDIDKLFQQHVNSNALATLAVRNRTSSRYFLFDSNDQLQGWQNSKTNEKILVQQNIRNLNPLAFSGIQIVKHEFISLIPPNQKVSLTPLYINLASNYSVKAFDHTNDIWFDCGKIETLLQAENYLKQFD